MRLAGNRGGWVYNRRLGNPQHNNTLFSSRSLFLLFSSSVHSIALAENILISVLSALCFHRVGLLSWIALPAYRSSPASARIGGRAFRSKRFSTIDTGLQRFWTFQLDVIHDITSVVSPLLIRNATPLRHSSAVNTGPTPPLAPRSCLSYNAGREHPRNRAECP